MSKSERMKLTGREMATRLTGILNPTDGVIWNTPADERDKARHLLSYLEGQRALHYPYDREIGSFIVQSVFEISARLTRDIQALSMDSLLGRILLAMQAACRKFLDENQSPSAGYGGPYQAQLYCTLGELRALLGIHIARIVFTYDLEVDTCLADILPPEPKQEADERHNMDREDSEGV